MPKDKEREQAVRAAIEVFRHVYRQALNDLRYT